MSAPAHTPGFFKLPLEIRQEIYSLLLPYSKLTHSRGSIAHRGQSSVTNIWYQTGRNSCSILQINRAIHCEVSQFFYNNCMFEIRIWPKALRHRSLPKYAPCLRLNTTDVVLDEAMSHPHLPQMRHFYVSIGKERNVPAKLADNLRHGHDHAPRDPSRLSFYDRHYLLISLRQTREFLDLVPQIKSLVLDAWPLGGPTGQEMLPALTVATGVQRATCVSDRDDDARSSRLRDLEQRLQNTAPRRCEANAPGEDANPYLFPDRGWSMSLP